MSALVPAEAPALEVDPVQHMSVVLNRAKGWLEEAKSIDEVREQKHIAVVYETALREKELAFDAQLTASELVRRCERRIGELVREGQREGTIAARGQHLSVPPRGVEHISSPSEFIEGGNKAMGDTYAMADAPAEQFEQAIAEARQEGNLSRANVVRKVKGEERAPLTGRGLTLAQAHARDSDGRISRIWGCAEFLAKQDVRELCEVTTYEERRVWLEQLATASSQIRDFRKRLEEIHRG